jgi:hypothetical protein
MGLLEDLRQELMADPLTEWVRVANGSMAGKRMRRKQRR